MVFVDWNQEIQTPPAKMLAVSMQTALPILRKLKDAGILRPLREKSGRRSAILAFPELLNRAEGRQVI